MEFIKRNWKNIAIILFCLLFLGTCASKNNYKRKLRITGDDAAVCIDSLERVISENTASYKKYCDSIEKENESRKKEIQTLYKDIEIYKEQNDKLHNKKVTIVIKENNKEQ